MSPEMQDLTDELAEALSDVNRISTRLARNLEHEPNLTEAVLTLASKAEGCKNCSQRLRDELLDAAGYAASKPA